MSTVLWILGSTIIVSLISFIGVAALSLKKGFLTKALAVLVAFAAGALIGVSFFDLIPEAIEVGQSQAPVYLVSGILIFFAVERFVGWHHAHHEHDIDPRAYHQERHDKYHHKPFIYTNLIADGIHNFLDGTLIAASFLVDIPVGIGTTIAVALHEIPQEIGDFAILVHGGLRIRSALAFNFISALTAVAGGLAVIYLSSAQSFELINPLLLGIGGGGLLYLALTDILPEINKENNWKNSIAQFASLLAGLGIIYSLALFFPA